MSSSRRQRRARRIGGASDPLRAAFWTPAEVQIVGPWGPRGVVVERASNGGFYMAEVADLTLTDPPRAVHEIGADREASDA